MTTVEERKSTQLRLQMLEARLRRQQREIRRLEADAKLHANLFDAIGAAVFILDAQHRFLDINPAAARLLGTSAEALRGQACHRVMHCRDTPPEGCPLTTAINTRRHTTGVMQAESIDRHVWVSCTPVLDDSGEVERVIHVADAITREILARRDLEASEDQFRLLAENSDDIIWTMGADARLIYVNPAAERLLGYRPEELIAQPISKVLLPDDHQKAMTKLERFLAALADGKRDASPVRLELAQRRRDGCTVDTEVVVNKVFDQEGRFRFFIGVSRDITERQRREEVLRRANKLEAVGVLAGGLAHDFNNLLSVILGNLEMTLADEAALPLERYLQAAREATLRSRDLTHQLLAFAKGGDPVRQFTALKPIIEETLARTPMGEGIVPRIIVDPDLKMVAVDRLQMGTAIGNLLQNAVEAMPDGGELTITARPYRLTDRDAALMIPGNDGRYVKLTIADQGRGIPDEVLPLIFDPYFTTKPAGAQKGLGLGLALAYAVVKRHGGEVSVDTAPGRGTQFSLLLPVGDALLPQRPVPKVATATRRILLMDDEEQLRVLCGQMLNYLGYSVETAADGGAAVVAFRRAREAGQAFGLVILDLTVKSGMGGKDTLQELRRIDPEVLAVVSSGYNEDPVMTDPQRYGFAAVLPKPYALTDLTDLLAKVLPKPSQQA
jgi:PAS domain S-box-containing protein